MPHNLLQAGVDIFNYSPQEIERTMKKRQADEGWRKLQSSRKRNKILSLCQVAAKSADLSPVSKNTLNKTSSIN